MTLRYLLVLAIALLGAAGHAAERLDYRLRWLPHAAPARLQAELRWRGDASGRTVLRLPDEWAAARGYADDLIDLRVQGATLEPGATPHERVLRHRPGAPLRLSWQIEPRDPSPTGPAALYRNHVTPRYFHVFGHGVWIVPQALADDDARIDWSVRIEAPAGMSLVTSHGTNHAGRIVAARRGVPFETLRHALMAGGDFRVVTGQAGGQPLTVALLGPRPFDVQALASRVQAIVAAQRAHWRSAPAGDRLAVTLIPNGLARGSLGGTMVESAFAMAASDDLQLDDPRFAHLIAHEHMHRWVPAAFGALRRDEALDYWFSEGFTDHLAHRTLVAAGLWSLQDYAQAMNRRNAEWLVSPAREADNARVAAGFFGDAELQRLPYLRGEWLALHWHAGLDPAHGGLDALLRGLARASAEPAALATDRLLAALDAPLHGAARAELERYVTQGTMVDFDAQHLGPCFDSHAEPLRVFEAGADRAGLLERKRVEQLVADSALARAGAQEGDRVLALDLLRDPEREASMSVERGDGSRHVLRWLPARELPGRSRPVYTVRAGAAADPACRAWFGVARFSTATPRRPAAS